jgi:hypothetical protein
MFSSNKKIKSILIILFLMILGFITVHRAAWGEVKHTDYTVYTIAAQAISDGNDIYKVQNEHGWNYVYPPPFAIFCKIFNLFSAPVGAFIFYILEILSIGGTIWMSRSLIIQQYGSSNKTVINHLSFITLLSILICSPQLIAGILRCQASEFVIFATIASFYWYLHKKFNLAGISLAIATIIKVFPGSLIIYFLWRKQWKLVFSYFLALLFIGGVLPSMAYGVNYTKQAYTEWVEVIAMPALSNNTVRGQDKTLYDQLTNANKPRNQSMEAMLLSLNLPAVDASILSKLIACLMLAAMTLIKNRDQKKSELIMISAFITWQLLIPPISENHYFGATIFPLMVLLTSVIDKNKKYKIKIGSILFFGIISDALLRFHDYEISRSIGLFDLLVWFLLLIELKVSNRYVLFKSRRLQA